MVLRFTLISLLSASFLLGCANIRRSDGSGYAVREDHGSSFKQRSIRNESLETQKFAAEMGFAPDENLTAEQWRQIENRRRLRALESRMDSAREKEQYSKVLPWLGSDEEKIQLLSIPTLEGR